MRKFSNLLTTIATASPLKAEEFLKKYNMPKPASINELIAKMYIVVKKHGNDAMYDLAAIHPDKDLIIAAYKAKVLGNNAPIEVSYQACGCSAEGDPETPNKTFLKKEVTIGNVLIYGGLGLIALTLFIKVIKG